MDQVVSEENKQTVHLEWFRELIDLFSEIEHSVKLFPKECRTCGRKFKGMSDYLCETSPKGHSFEDCRQVMGKPFTMVYRHCTCGNTLVLTLTEENFPLLNSFWTILCEEAEHSGVPLKVKTTEFCQMWEDYLNPSR